MRVLMQNTVSKTAALAGLFSCVLMLAVVFFGITASVHATHNENFIHAEDVGTDQEKLKQFVEAAIDAYYIDFIFREHCTFPPEISGQFPFDRATAPVGVIRPFIAIGEQLGISLTDFCDYTQPFGKVFRSEDAEDGEWKSDSIYLYVMDDQGKLLFHGADPSLEDAVLVAEDKGGRDVADEIINEVQDANGDGFVQYCWDDPATDEDNEPNPDSMTAPGDSWKINYVVDPFKYFDLMQSSGVIFGSGIYPKTGTPPDGCKIYGGMEPMDDMQEPVEEPMDEPEDVVEEAMDDVGDSISGGGCAIAAGSDSTPRNDALNLLLIVSALFFAVSFGNRAVGRRNGIRS